MLTNVPLPCLRLNSIRTASAPQIAEAEAELLSDQLAAFYARHNPANMSMAPGLAREYAGREKKLNRMLREKYGHDMTSLRAQAAPFSVHSPCPVTPSLRSRECLHFFAPSP
jgi:hypothetical protein